MSSLEGTGDPRAAKGVALTDYEKDLRDKLFGNPLDWPDAAKVWIADYVSQNSLIPIGQVRGWQQSVAFVGAVASRTTTQSFTTSVALMVFDQVTIDTDSFWDVAHASRLTVPVGKDGVYLVNATGGFGDGTQVTIQQNSESLNTNMKAGGEKTATIFLSLVAGDYVVATAYTEVGGVNQFPTLSMMRVSGPPPS